MGTEEIAREFGRHAMTCVAELVGCRPTKQNIASSIPRQGTGLGCRFGPQSGYVREATDKCSPLTSMFISHSSSLPSPLSKNE